MCGVENVFGTELRDDMKCFKRAIVKRRLCNLMKVEKEMVRVYCEKIDWENTAKWLHRSKCTVKAYRRITKRK